MGNLIDWAYLVNLKLFYTFVLTLKTTLIMTTKAKAVKPAATERKKSTGRGRNIYFRDENLWKKLEKLAEQQDRSVNYVIEQAVLKVTEKTEV